MNRGGLYSINKGIQVAIHIIPVERREHRRKAGHIGIFPQQRAAAQDI